MRVLLPDNRMLRSNSPVDRVASWPLSRPHHLCHCVSVCCLFLAFRPAASQSAPTQVEDRTVSQGSLGDQGLTLDQAIDLALAHNGGLAVARLDVQNFEALKAKARAQYLPTLTNDSDASYLTAREGVVLPTGSLGVFPGGGDIPPKTLHIDQGGNLTYSSRTFLSQPTLQLFAVHAANHAAKVDVRTAHLNVEDKSEEVAVQVRQLYYRSWTQRPSSERLSRQAPVRRRVTGKQSSR